MKNPLQFAAGGENERSARQRRITSARYAFCDGSPWAASGACASTSWADVSFSDYPWI